MCLASGSSGNCYYLESEEGGMLIDVGIPLNDIQRALAVKGLSLDKGHIKAILITHDHADHIRTVGILASRYHLPVYASERVHRAISNCRYIYEDISAYRRYISLHEPFTLLGFNIVPFKVPHDSRENYGYYISLRDFRFMLATDIGSLTEDIIKYARQSNYLVVEANYDEDMLMSGVYPEFLKKRVSSPLGHLSNKDTAELLCQAYHLDMKKVWLCHLSKENNNPELCLKTIEDRLFREGIRSGKDLEIMPLKRHTPSPLYILED